MTQVAVQQLSELATPDLLAEVAAMDDLHALRARTDPSAFVSYVMRDEETGRPIRLQPMHEEWQRLVTFHPRLVLWAHVEAGKTFSVACARVLYELGRDTTLRVAIVSNTDMQAQKVCLTIAKYIEQSAEYKKVFPGVVKAVRFPWTAHQLYVQRPTVSRDPSVRTCGVHGNILGARIDLLVIDDVLDYENTLTTHSREDLWAWYASTLAGRLTARARVVCIGTAWHRDDIMHRFARRPDFEAVRYPVMDEQGRSNWPERWPSARIEARRAEGMVEFNRQLLCVARSDEESRFRYKWIQNCLARGEGQEPIYALKEVPAGFATYTGVDLGVRVKEGSDLTCLFTIIVHPNGDRQVLDVQAGRWDGPDIVELIKEVHRRYLSIVVVEDNAAQQFIVQFTKKSSAVPVMSHTTTGASIKHPQFGIEAMAVEMANGKWIVPSKYGQPANAQIRAWVDELLFYDPASHPGDRLMASHMAVNGIRLTRPKAKVRQLDLLSR